MKKEPFFVFINRVFRKASRRSEKKGVALLLALLSLLIVSVVVVAFFVLSTIDLQISTNHYLRKEALYIAEAGVEYAISVLSGSKSAISQSVQFPSGSGHYYDVTYVTSNSTITSIGRLASGERVTLVVKVGHLGSAPFKVKVLSWREA